MRRPALTVVLLLAIPAVAHAEPATGTVKKNQSEVASNDYANSTDVVFVSEGYRASEADDFFEDAKKLAHQLATYQVAEPIRRGRPLNFHYVFVNSKDKGASFKPGDPARDTACGVYVDAEETMCADDARADAHAARGSAGDVDVVIVVTRFKAGKKPPKEDENDEGRAPFAPGDVRPNADVPTEGSRVRMSMDDPKSFIHEFGHAHYGLDDEYWDAPEMIPADWASDVARCPNTSCDPSGRRWGKSPNAIFQGGSGYKLGVWRPEKKCRMNQSRSEDFCSACTKAILSVGKKAPVTPQITEPSGRVKKGPVRVTWKGSPSPAWWEVEVLDAEGRSVEKRAIEGHLRRASFALGKGRYVVTVMARSIDAGSNVAEARFTVETGDPPPPKPAAEAATNAARAKCRPTAATGIIDRIGE